jgi:hypothetical protein
MSETLATTAPREVTDEAGGPIMCCKTAKTPAGSQSNLTDRPLIILAKQLAGRPPHKVVNADVEKVGWGEFDYTFAISRVPGDIASQVRYFGFRGWREVVEITGTKGVGIPETVSMFDKKPAVCVSILFWS